MTKDKPTTSTTTTTTTTCRYHGHRQAPSMVTFAAVSQELVCREVNSAKKCGSFGFGRTLQALLGPLPRCNGIMFQDQGSNGSTRSSSHATSPQHNANTQVHLKLTKRNLIHYSNRTYLGLSKHGKAYVAQPRRAHIPKSLLELAGPVSPHRCSLHLEKATRCDFACVGLREGVGWHRPLVLGLLGCAM